MPRELDEQEFALISMFFVGEDETFPVFKEWGMRQGLTIEFVQKISDMTVGEYREIALAYWIKQRNGSG
jgi:hypothetical protein